MTLDLDDDFMEVDAITGEVTFVTTTRRRRRRNTQPPRDPDQPLWAREADPFRAALCRPDSTRRFQKILAEARSVPDFDRVRRGRARIEDLPSTGARQVASLLAENYLA